MTEIPAKQGELWKNMNDKEKAKYVEMSNQDHARYERECNQLKSCGYFINSQGVSSLTMKKKGSKEEEASKKA